MPTCVRGVSVFISPKAKKLWDSLNETIAELPQEVSCRESDPDAWFPDEDDHMKNGKTSYVHVKKMCAVCPVKNLCLEYALTNNERYGLWGGMSPEDRKNLVRTQRRHRKQA